MKCLLCKADSMVANTNTYFAQLPNGDVIIENVPCLKCTQCGEVVYSTSVMERIDEILKTAQAVASKIFIMNYTEAA
jgi:YgiT-type zinc finger domain-containing protein